MKYRLLDLLACPMCKHFPLQLLVFSERKYKREVTIEKTPVCEELCGYRKVKIKDLKDAPCKECLQLEVVTGILICEKCNRWYPIIDEIPRMLPDDLRDSKEDLGFLKKYSNLIPRRILEEGKPFNLAESEK